MIRRDILPHLGKHRVADVGFADIDRLHRLITKRAPYRATRVVALLSKMFALAIRWGWRSDNPASGIERNPEEPRATGARYGEAAKATWGQFDLDRGIWAKGSAHTKQKRPPRPPLPAPALAPTHRAATKG